MKKLFTLVCAAVFSLGLMAADVTLADIDFTDSSWSGKTFSQGNNNNVDLINDIYFWSKSDSKHFSLADNTTKGLTFPNNNISTSNYYFCIPLTSINDKITVTLTHAYNSTKASFSYGFADGREEFVNGNAGTVVTKVTDANSSDTQITFAVEVTNGKGHLFIGRGGSDFTNILKVKVTTPEAETNPVAAVSIAGPTVGAKDYKAAFTATTDAKANAYKWFVNDTEQAGATDKTFEFTPDALGDYNIVCKARNAINETDEWIASDAISFKAVPTPCGELIKATLTSGTEATVTGVIGGTADVSLSSNLKMDKGKYFGIQLASGNFLEGDTVVISMSTAGSNYPCLFADKNRTNCLYLATETSSALEYKIVLPAEANSVNTIYVSRGDDTDNYKWNPILSSMTVIRPVAVEKEVETLTAVTINDVAISAANLATLVSAKTLTLEDSYVNAPVVKFTKHIVTTYEDESVKESDEVIEKTSTQASAGMWGASASIGGNPYTVYTVKKLSYTVTYYDGATKLGEELVAANGNPAKYAEYESKSLYSFEGWFNNADLAPAHAVANIAAEVITANATYYAKFEKTYATSINIEKWILINGAGKGTTTKTSALIAELGDKYFASNLEWKNGNIELDSLSNKDDRNEPYLGLKVKKAGSMIDLRLAKDSYVKVKFGAIKSTKPQVSINGGDYVDMTITDGVYEFTAEEEAVVSIKTADDNAVVFKQIMIDEDIEEVILPDVPSALDNTNATVKATKVVRNGQLLIEKNGETYNILGTRVR